MSAHKIEQLVHGYRRGHEQLGGSIKLTSRDAELITRLSDLSGSLSGAPKFISYLTVYPLPSGKFFALGKTWPDPEAARAGCVLTHTLLVPMSLWAALPEPRLLQSLFVHPSSPSIPDFGTAITIPEDFPVDSSALEERVQNSMLTFVQMYFGEGKRPIVWFGQEGAEEILWRILGGLWPGLRTHFSACTLCLQPRTLEDRLFELMFAPATVYSRFLKLPTDHFVDANAKSRADQTGASADQWSRAWVKRLMGPRKWSLPLGDFDLWAELDDDPTSARRLFLINALMEEKSPEPQMFVGAMDLVESLSKHFDSAVVSKRVVAQRAVRAAQEATDPTKGLECLQLIENRLRRATFLRVQDEIGPTLKEAVSDIFQRFPRVISQLSTVLPAESDLTSSYFGKGILHGCKEVAKAFPDALLGLRNSPTILTQVFEAEPEVGTAFARAAAAQRTDPEIRADLLRWLAAVHEHSLRSSIRTSLAPMLGSDDLDLWMELLRDLRSEDVKRMLDALWHQADHFENLAIRDLVQGRIASDYPGETRDWTNSLTQCTTAVAQVFAATFPPTRQGLLDLLNVNCDPKQKAEAVAAFLYRVGPERYPYWVLDAAREQGALLATLLDNSTNSSMAVVEQTTRLLRHAGAVPIANSPALLRMVLDSAQQPFFSLLLDLTMASLIPGYVAGMVSDSANRSFQEDPSVHAWFEATRSQEIVSLVTRDTRASKQRWINAWEWTVNAPDELYSRQKPLLPELIDVLSRSHYSDWSAHVSALWSEILRRTRTVSVDQRTRLILCVQALKFSFENTRLPLGSVVAETFCDVYKAVTESSKLPAETAPLFGSFDWDKGKELRRKLVDSFYYSKWQPGDLFLSVPDERLFRKIFKRLTRRNGGEIYAKEALLDLEYRTSPKPPQVITMLRNLLINPDYYEEWD